MTLKLSLKEPVSFQELHNRAVKAAIAAHGANAVFTDNVLDGNMLNVLKHEFLEVDGIAYDKWLRANQWSASYQEMTKALPDFVKNNGFAFLFKVAQSRVSLKGFDQD